MDNKIQKFWNSLHSLYREESRQIISEGKKSETK
jgi:hypothetical protein